MLTESKIILPLMDNDGVSLREEREKIERRLLNSFCGFNRSVSSGAWMDPNTGRVYQDDCMTYTIAADWSLESARLALFDIAEESARIMRQECIYVSVSGQVHFVEPVRIPAIAAE